MHHTLWGAPPAKDPLTQRGYLIHCMPGWRAFFCVLDNLAPHRHVLEADDCYTEGRRGFGWVCRLHDRVGQ